MMLTWIPRTNERQHFTLGCRYVDDTLLLALLTSYSHYAVFRINDKITKTSFFASTEDRHLSLKKADILNQFTALV